MANMPALQVLIDRAHIFISSLIPLKSFIEIGSPTQGNLRFRTAVRSGKSPIWCEVFEVPHTDEGFLEFKLYDKGMFSQSLKGTGNVPLDKVLRKGFENGGYQATHNGRVVAEVLINIQLKGHTPQYLPRPLHRAVEDKRNFSIVTHGLSLSDILFEDKLYSSVNGKQAVYNARTPASPNRVAVKVTYCHSTDEFNFVQREAMTMCQMSHHNICKFYASLLDTSYGTLNNLLVMEKVEGGDLALAIEQRNKARSQWPEEGLLRHFYALLSAFAHIQGKGIVHSDIKPQNLVLTPEDELKVIDFGISLISPAEHFGTTCTFKVGGTVPYFSPLQLKAYVEFVSGRNPSGQVRHNPYKSDVFSLGLTFFHMASLKAPTGFNALQEATEGLVARGVARLEYSARVKQLLRRMLVLEEAARPDFLILKQEFQFT